MSKEKKQIEDAVPQRVSFKPIEDLEKAAKVGFYCEGRQVDDSILEPLFRLRCESKDGESEDSILTPWCTSQTLGAMVQGCLYLQPLLVATIQDRQKNADNPEK